MTGYQVPKAGVDALLAKFNGLQRQIDALRSAAGILSAVIGKGGVTVKDGGSIAVEDGGGLMVTDGGFITSVGGTIRAVHETTGAAMAYFGRLLPPYKSGLLAATEAGDAYFWAAVMADGTKSFEFEGASHRVDATSNYSNGSTWRADATDSITLNTPSLRLYGLPTTGAAANVRLETAGGTPVLQFVTSSRRYKTDIADAQIDPADVLKLRPRVWRDRGEVERDGDGARTNIGFIAEEVDELESLRPTVDYDGDNRPDALQYERIPTGLVVLAQQQEKRIADLEKQNAALSARLDALESN